MMPSGCYYVGDLCYVLPDTVYGEEFLPGYCKENGKVVEGEWSLPSGAKIAVYSTAYGDGAYRDQLGRKYLVDAGLIGCIKVEDLKKMGVEDIPHGGHLVWFAQEFRTGYIEKNGVIVFGRVRIETDPDMDYSQYDEDEYGGTEEYHAAHY